MQDFQGRTAFVTGAASGIGLGLVRALLDEGANVMLADVEEAALQKAMEDLSSADNRIDSVVCDVADSWTGTSRFTRSPVSWSVTKRETRFT